MAKHILAKTGLTLETFSIVKDLGKATELRREIYLAAFGLTQRLDHKTLGEIVGNAKHSHPTFRTEESEGTVVEVLHLVGQPTFFDAYLPEGELGEQDGIQLLRIVAAAEITACFWNTIIFDYLDRAP